MRNWPCSSFFKYAVILALCQIVGSLARHAGQPQVVAEMITGVLLGPSLFDFFVPACFTVCSRRNQ